MREGPATGFATRRVSRSGSAMPNLIEAGEASRRPAALQPADPAADKQSGRLIEERHPFYHSATSTSPRRDVLPEKIVEECIRSTSRAALRRRRGRNTGYDTMTGAAGKSASVTVDVGTRRRAYDIVIGRWRAGLAGLPRRRFAVPSHARAIVTD